MSHVVVVPQPWVHLILSGQVDCIPGCRNKAPKDACGERVGLMADGVDWFAAASLLRNFPMLSFPLAKAGRGRGLWLPKASTGRWKTTQRPDYSERTYVRSDAPSELVMVEFNEAERGSVLLAGWLLWAEPGSKPSAIYRADQSRSAKLHKCAHGPACWVLRSPNSEKVQGARLRPLEAP